MASVVAAATAPSDTRLLIEKALGSLTVSVADWLVLAL